MKSLVTKVNSSYDIAVVFFLFSGSLYFIYYSLNASKYIYILFSVIIYVLGAFVRKYLFRIHATNEYTEPGIFLISFLLAAYILYLTNLDVEIGEYLPDKILLQAGSAFVFITLVSIFSSFKKSVNKPFILLIIISTIILIQLYQSQIDALFFHNPQTLSFIIGMPLVYLIYIVFGLSGIIKRISSWISLFHNK